MFFGMLAWATVWLIRPRFAFRALTMKSFSACSLNNSKFKLFVLSNVAFGVEFDFELSWLA